MIASQPQHRIGFTSEDIPSCCHACLIYDDDLQRKRIVSRFLAAGLENGEHVGYFSDGTSGEEIRSWFGELGVAIPERNGRECLSISDAICAYTADKPFEPREMITRTLRAAEAASATGFSALRSTGEMTWVLRGCLKSSSRRAWGRGARLFGGFRKAHSPSPSGRGQGEGSKHTLTPAPLPRWGEGMLALRSAYHWGSQGFSDTL
jgi:hypothetical protein